MSDVPASAILLIIYYEIIPTMIVILLHGSSICCETRIRKLQHFIEWSAYTYKNIYKTCIIEEL